MAAPQYVFVMKGLSKTWPGGKQFLKDIVTTFLDGALALQANAGYQINSGVAVLSRAKINF